MAEVKTSIIVDLAGNIQQRGRQYINTLNNIGSQGSRSFQLMRQSANMTGRGLDALGNRYTALLTGAAGVGAAKMVMDHQRRLTRLAISADRSSEEIHALNEEIFRTAEAPDIRLDPGEITSAIEEIMEKTGDLRFAEQNIRNIGLAIQATGATGKDIGGLMAEFQKMGITDFSAVLRSFDVLNVQGKKGAFTVANFAAMGPRLLTAYSSMGRGGEQAVREMGAAIQVVRMGTGGPEQATTAMEALLRTLSDGKKLKMLQKGGIQVFDPAALKQGKEVLRPINELMVEIVKRTGGKKTLLSEVFDAEAMRTFNSLIDEYKRTGDITRLAELMNVQADGTTTIKNSGQAANDATGAVTNLHTAWKKFADDDILGPIKALADTANKLDPSSLQTGMKVASYGALGVGGLMVGRKLYQGGKSIAGMFRRGGAGPTGAMGGLTGGGGPIPVYVVNKQLSMLPGKDGFGANQVPPGGGGGNKPGKIGGGLVKAAAVAGAGATGWEIGSAINWGLNGLVNMMTNDKYKGSDGAIGAWLFDALHKMPPQEAKVDLNIKIDSEGRPKVQSMGSSGRSVTPNVDAGLTMRSH